MLGDDPAMKLKQQTARRIARLYFIAIALIALLTLISQGFLQSYLYQLSFDSREINLAGKMRMLSQRTVKLALLIQRDQQPELHREQLEITTSELFNIFDGLENGSTELEVQPPPNAETEQLFAQAAPVLKVSLDAADQLMLETPGTPGFEHNLQTLIDNDESLLQAIARIPAAYDTIAKADVVRLEWIELALMVITLFVLLLELRFIFRPILTVALDALSQVETDAIEAQRLRRLASMGEMSGGVAHELNSPLAALSFAIQRLQRRISRGREITHAELEEQLDKMATDALRMSEIVQSIRALAAGKLPEPKKPIYADALLRRIVDSFNARFGRPEVELRIVPGGEDVVVHCVAYQLEQVLINLIKNAVEATENLDHPWVELSAAVDGENIIFMVRDAGSGIPHETADRIFDPFFSTKEIGGGMGLGLALSQRLTELHGGHLQYRVVDGHTAFVVSLPG